jgi:bifunctional UDP-N-acetylglucosamine pyrophosphorylase/glucosamine-1-phosphate N-acetyltransferase
MQAIILAAGRGKRMNHLTNETPKPMLKIGGKTVAEYKLAILPKTVREIIFIIGHFGEQIRNHFGNSYKGVPIKYLEQKRLQGTGSALFLAKDLIIDRFLVMMGDDIYAKKDLERCLKHRWSLLAKKMNRPAKGAKIVFDENKNILDILERTMVGRDEYNNAGLYVMDRRIFNYPLVAIGNGEFGLPQTLALAAKDIGVKVVRSTSWHQISTPEDLERVEKVFARKKTERI